MIWVMGHYRRKKESKLPKRADLKGMRIGSLTVIGPIPGTRAWLCLCECQKNVKVQHNRLIDKNNPKTHCGCKRGGLPKQYKKEYHCWWDTKARCHDPKHPSYKTYGFRGQSMTPRWQDSFEAFINDMGPAPKDHILGLKTGEVEYAPGKAVWVLKPMHKKGSGVKMVLHPKTNTPIRVSDLAKEYGLKYHETRAELIKMGRW